VVTNLWKLQNRGKYTNIRKVLKAIQASVIGDALITVSWIGEDSVSIWFCWNESKSYMKSQQEIEVMFRSDGSVRFVWLLICSQLIQCYRRRSLLWRWPDVSLKNKHNDLSSVCSVWSYQPINTGLACWWPTTIWCIWYIYYTSFVLLNDLYLTLCKYLPKFPIWSLLVHLNHFCRFSSYSYVTIFHLIVYFSMCGF
jgi:hypothetical protein